MIYIACIFVGVILGLVAAAYTVVEYRVVRKEVRDVVSQIITDSRLIGRSVWNREWMLIIPGESLLFDPNEALDIFIDGDLIPGSADRDGNGVSDIKLFFQTYAYSGN